MELLTATFNFYSWIFRSVATPEHLRTNCRIQMSCDKTGNLNYQGWKNVKNIAN